MGGTTKPHVVVVDDNPDAERTSLDLWESDVQFTVLHPKELTKQKLEEADLVLVDYLLEDWPERDALDEIGLQPVNGLALAAVLRAHSRSVPTPTAFALRSAHLDDISAPFLPSESRLYVLARANNLEWVFPKQSGGKAKEIIHQIAILASAVRRLPEHWPTEDVDKTRQLLEKFMAVPEDVSWCGQAWLDIVACHPPIHELVEASHGLAFLRWLLHRILPYPCFLLDTHHLATRLRLTYSSLQDALTGELGSVLNPFQYHGALADFLGPRWWRSGIETFVWDVTEGNSFDPQYLRDRLSEKVGVKLEPSASSQPVVCIDKDYQPLPDACDPTQVLRIQPDDWPPYADQAWTTIALARENPHLAALVLEQDRDQLA